MREETPEAPMGKSLPCQNGREKTAKHSKLKEPLGSSGRTDFEVALASNILFKGSVEPSALKDQVVAAVIAIGPRRPALEKRYGTM